MSYRKAANAAVKNPYGRGCIQSMAKIERLSQKSSLFCYFQKKKGNRSIPL
jgi:hypothetical protein